MSLEHVRSLQETFESNLQGTDTDLKSVNTAAYSLERGIIGEGYEALEALSLYGVCSEEFRNEIVDIYVFFASLLNHINMSAEELADRSRRIVFKNFIKYHPRNFEGRTVKEGLEHSRSLWNKPEEVLVFQS